jgi:glucose/arabinose dehydrogenase
MTPRSLTVCCLCCALLALASTAQTSAGPTDAVQPTGTPPGVTPVPPGHIYTDFSAVTTEGQPIERRPPEKADDKPAFPGQTRAPYHASESFKVATLTDKLKSPWSLAFLPDGNMLVTEKPGTMRIVGGDGTLSAPLADVPAVLFFGQVGLLDVALDRHFAANHRIFFTFAEPVGTADSRIAVARARLADGAAGLSEVKVIFRSNPALPGKTLSDNSGGRIAIGRDGNLFVSIGDRSKSPPWDMAQKLDNDLGKIIHITPDGKVPPGNPFIGRPGALPEIWSYGHRNPQGLAFDAQHRLWDIEHGPRGGDKLDLIKAGKNYGWPVIVHGIDYPGMPIGAGITEKPGMEQPRYYWDPDIAPTGLAFYTGALFPKWKHSVFTGALRGMMLDRLEIAGTTVVAEEPLLLDLHDRVRDVRVGPEGALYVLTGNGKLLKLTPR